MFPKETNILVVDDSYNIRQVIVDSLKRLGFSKITTAGDANEALGHLTQSRDTSQSITLVLSDLNMPGPSGIDFLKQIHGMSEFENLPFLLITTESEKGAVIEAATAGVSGYIVKPFNLDTLTKRLKEAWAKHNKD